MKIKKKDSGSSMVEYALLAALIAVGCIAAISILGKKIEKQFSVISSQI